jgi:hypothetical protein
MFSGRMFVAPRRAARQAAFVLVWAALAAAPRAAGSADSAAELPGTPDNVKTSSTAAHVDFRLGDAGRPFGWATGVADFNTDGRADVASIDRIASRRGFSSYRLQFSVSGLRVDDIAFDSDEQSLALSVSDVDRDNDLDVIVSGVPSGQTIGVWLNDGHGRFTHADPPPFPAARSASAFDALGPSSDPPPGWVPTSQHAAPILAGIPTPDAFGASSIVGGYGTGLTLPLAFLSQAGPRAPPIF